jgi:hypothetical protein
MDQARRGSAIYERADERYDRTEESMSEASDDMVTRTACCD